MATQTNPNNQSPTVQPSTGDAWKVGFFILVIFIIILLAIFGIYFYLQFSKNKELLVSPSPVSYVPSPIVVVSPPPQEIIPASPLPPVSAAVVASPPAQVQVSDFDLIRQAMASKHNKPLADTQIVVSKNTGTHAQGSVKFSGDIGGGWFLAAKTGTIWVIVDDGNGTISCQVIAPYNFPNSIVPECWDEQTQKIVNR